MTGVFCGVYPMDYLWSDSRGQVEATRTTITRTRFGLLGFMNGRLDLRGAKANGIRGGRDGSLVGGFIGSGELT